MGGKPKHQAKVWGKVHSCKVERAYMRKCSAYFHTYLSKYYMSYSTMYQILISRMFGGKNYQSFLSSFPSFIFFAFLLNIHINLCVMYFSKLGFSEKSSLFFFQFLVTRSKSVRFCSNIEIFPSKLTIIWHMQFAFGKNVFA